MHPAHATRIERALPHQPLPVADALQALLAAESAHESRDRLVESFRSLIRTLAALALAARVQFGPGPDAPRAQLLDLVRKLQRGSLTDGEWLGLCRELLAGFRSTPEGHPLPELVMLFHGKNAVFAGRAVDALLGMRKKETVAHGTTGTAAAAREIVAQRLPALLELLEALEPLWQRARLAVPLSPAGAALAALASLLSVPPHSAPAPAPAPAPDSAPDSDPEALAPAAQLWMGPTPHRGRFRRVPLAASTARLEPGAPVLLDPEGRVILLLAPVALSRAPSPGAGEEFFVLDGFERRAAAYVALPSMAVFRQKEAASLLQSIADESSEEPESVGGVDRPYRGLASFGPEHAALFVGREALAQDVLNRVVQGGMVTVTGASGSGKSSLVRAGVIPALARSTAGFRDEDVPAWRAVFLRPGADPVGALARALSAEPALAEVMAAHGHDEPEALGGALARWSEDSGTGLLVVVDQAEELLTLCAFAPQREAFALTLVALAASARGRGRVLLTVREDFFARLSGVRALAGLYTRSVVAVNTPDRDALERILIEPARRFGYAFESRELLTRMLDAVEGEPAALALLQFAADRMWELRDRSFKLLTEASYEAIGGVAGALAKHGDAVLDAMTPVQQRAARAMLLRLVTAEGTRAVVPRAELLEASGARDEGVAVLDALVSARLLTARDAEGEGASVEIVHEALIGHWERLSRWRSEDREGQQVMHALRAASQEWQRRGRSRSLLWRGEALADARAWRRRASDALTAMEAEFLAQSEREERRAKRLRAGLLAGAFAALSSFAVVLAVQRGEARRSAERERVARGEAQRGQRRSEGMALLAQATGRYAGNPGALPLLRAAVNAGRGGADPEVFRRALGEGLLDRSLPLGRVFRGPAEKTIGVVMPDEDHVLALFEDGQGRLWDLRDGREIARLGEHHDEGYFRVAISPDRRVAAMYDGAHVWAWDTRTGEKWLDHRTREIHTIAALDGDTVAWVEGSEVRTRRRGEAAPRDVFALPPGPRERSYWDVWAVAAGGRALFRSGSADGFLTSQLPAELIPLSGGAPIRLRHDNADAHAELATFSADGTRLITVDDNTGFYWDASTGALLGTLQSHNVDYRVVEPSPTQPRWVTVTGDGLGTLWKEAEGRVGPVGEAAMHRGPVTAMAYSPDGERIATAGDDRAVRVWDILNGDMLAEVTGLSAAGSAMSFCPSGARLAVGTGEGTVTVLRPAMAPAVSVERPAFVVFNVYATPSPRGTRFSWSQYDEGPVEVRDARTGAKLGELPAEMGRYPHFCGEDHVVSTEQGALRTYDVATGRVWGPFPVGARAYVQSCVGDDRALLLDAAGRLSTVELSTGREVGVRPWYAALPPSTTPRDREVWWVHGGRVALMLEGDGPLRAVDGEMGAELARIPEVTWLGTALREPGPWVLFSGGSGRGRARWRGQWTLLDGATWRAARQWREVRSIAVSGDGAWAAVLDRSGELALERAADGSERRVLRRGREGAELTFSPDGALLAEVSGDAHAVRVWDVATGALLARVTLHRASTSVKAFFSDARRLVMARGRWFTVHDLSGLHADVARWSREIGAETNLRVCRDTLEVVPVLPYPAADELWAPEALCHEPAARGAGAGAGARAGADAGGDGDGGRRGEPDAGAADSARD